MEQFEAANRIRKAEAESDLIGAVYRSELFDLLGLNKKEGNREHSAWKAFAEALGTAAAGVPGNVRNDVEDLAQNFGNEREETGFRIGFHMAMRLCMEGMNGGAAL